MPAKKQPPATKASRLYDWLFRDKHGRIVIAQAPNLPIKLCFALAATALIVRQPLSAHHLLISMAIVLLFYWSLLEIISGVNHFRRLYGLVILGAAYAITGICHLLYWH